MGASVAALVLFLALVAVATCWLLLCAFSRHRRDRSSPHTCPPSVSRPPLQRGPSRVAPVGSLSARQPQVFFTGGLETPQPLSEMGAPTASTDSRSTHMSAHPKPPAYDEVLAALSARFGQQRDAGSCCEYGGPPRQCSCARVSVCLSPMRGGVPVVRSSSISIEELPTAPAQSPPESPHSINNSCGFDNRSYVHSSENLAVNPAPVHDSMYSDSRI